MLHQQNLILQSSIIMTVVGKTILVCRLLAVERILVFPTSITGSPVQSRGSTCIYMITKPQLPWLQTSHISHTGLDVKKEVIQCTFLPIPGIISCTGVTGSGRITCHAHVTLMSGHVYVYYYTRLCIPGTGIGPTASVCNSMSIFSCIAAPSLSLRWT